MADYQVGSLYYEVKADTRGVKASLDDVDRSAKNAAKSAKELKGSFRDTGTEAQRLRTKMKPLSKSIKDVGKDVSGLGLALTALVSAYGATKIITTYIENTKQAELVQSQLRAVLLSTGEAAGFTQRQLESMSRRMAASSLFSDVEIQKGQTRLLGFVNVIGKDYPRAMQVAIDMAQRMGTSLEAAAEIVGRSIDVPSRSFMQLTRHGINFTDAQKKLIKELEESGRVSEAQGVILAKLEERYKGAAEEARTTFGGALADLQMSIRDLMTGSPHSLENLGTEVRGLAKWFRDPSLKRAVDGFGSLVLGVFADIVMAARKVTAAISTVTSAYYWLTDKGRALGLRLTEKRIESLRAQIEKEPDSPWVDRWKQHLDELLTHRSRTLEEMNRHAPVDETPSVDASARRAVTGSDATTDAANARRAEDAAKRYLDAIRRRIVATEKLSNVEQVLRDIEEGRLILSGSITRDMVLGAAEQLDAAEKLSEATEKAKRLQESLKTEQEKLNDTIAEYDDLLRQNLITVDEHVRATQNLKDEVSGLAAMIDAAPWKKLEQAQQDMIILAEAYKAGRFGEVGSAEAEAKYAETAQARLGTLPKTIDEVKDGFKDLTFAIEGWGKRSAEAITDFVMTGKASFKDLIGSIMQDIMSMMVYETITKPIAAAASKGIGSVISSIFARAGGGPVSANNLYRVNERGPELYEEHGKQYLMTGPRSGRIVKLSHGGTQTTAAEQQRPREETGKPTRIVNFSFNFPHVTDVDSFRKSSRQIESELSRSLRRSEAIL